MHPNGGGNPQTHNQVYRSSHPHSLTVRVQDGWCSTEPHCGWENETCCANNKCLDEGTTCVHGTCQKTGGDDGKDDDGKDDDGKDDDGKADDGKDDDGKDDDAKDTGKTGKTGKTSRKVWKW